MNGFKLNKLNGHIRSVMLLPYSFYEKQHRMDVRRPREDLVASRAAFGPMCVHNAVRGARSPDYVDLEIRRLARIQDGGDLIFVGRHYNLRLRLRRTSLKITEPTTSTDSSQIPPEGGKPT